VHLVDIKPCFVATTMIERLPLPSPLVLTPDKAAKDLVRAEKKYMLYTLWFWWDIMLIIRNVPRFVFTRASL
jgi:hypothetical protein